MFSKLGKKEHSVNLIMGILKMIGNIIRNGWIFYSFSKIGNQYTCCEYLFQHCIDSLAIRRSQEKEINDVRVIKEKMKLSLFMDNIAVYAENPQNSTNRLLKWVCKYSRVKCVSIHQQ